MTLCSHRHEPIVHEIGGCPLCEALNKLAEIQQEIISLPTWPSTYVINIEDDYEVEEAGEVLEGLIEGVQEISRIIEER
jgi:hypothetical protein